MNDMHIEVKKAMEKEQMISGGGGRGGRGGMGMTGGRGGCILCGYIYLRLYCLHIVPFL